MTAPEMEEAWPQLFRAGARALVENARRLGLTWRLTLGTVTAATNTDQLEVRLDGDTESITVLSMIGSHPIGARVYVISIPPAGNYCIGTTFDYRIQQLVDSEVMECDTNLTLTTSPQVLSGTTYTASTIGDFEYDVVGIFDFAETTAGVTVAIGELFINGIVVGLRNALFGCAVATDRATVVQQWHGTGTNGDVFDLRARKSAAAGVVSARTPHSCMGIKIYQ